MTKKQATSTKKNLKARIKRPLAAIKKRWQGFMQRRPHRSFKLTRRRDYYRNFNIKGYWAFTAEVTRLLLRHKKLFGSFVIVYGIASALLVGLMSNAAYQDFSTTIASELEIFGLDFSGAARTVTLAIATIGGVFTEPLSETQQIVGGLLILLGWMTMVWLLRQVNAGRAVRLRDGVYSSASPLVATAIVVLVILVQLLPIALSLIVYGVLTSLGIATEGVEAMLAWTVIIMFGVLSLYWVASSLVALVIVTLPGMYPFHALKRSGDLVLGRRTRVALRLVWALVFVLLAWLVLLIPSVILHDVIQVPWLPIVPIVVALLSSVTIVWFSAYVYLLYRRLIDDETKTA